MSVGISPLSFDWSKVLRFTEHTAAVKAIAWSPHQHGILASGGGTADRCIRFCNSQTSARLNCVDTGSQVRVFVCVFGVGGGVVAFCFAFLLQVRVLCCLFFLFVFVFLSVCLFIFLCVCLKYELV